MVVKVILAIIVVVNAVFAIAFVRDLIKNKGTVMKEPGNPIALAIYSAIVFLLSTFGISDFAIGTSVYPKTKWTTMEKLPGTLNTECVIPVAVMALCYISSIECDLATLIVAIVCQVVGSYVSPRFVVKLPSKTIKKFCSVALLITAGLILANKFGIYPSGGSVTGLTGGKLVLFGALMLIYGALNNIGIGSYALTMATVYAMGLNPAVTFPIMMGACTLSVPVGALQFIKYDGYSRKITLFCSIFGSLGVLVAVFIVKSLDTSLLLWLVTIVIIYSAITMLLSLKPKTESVG